MEKLLAQPGLPEQTPLVARARALHAVTTLPLKVAVPQFTASRAICAEAGDCAAYAAVLLAEDNAHWDYAY